MKTLKYVLSTIVLFIALACTQESPTQDLTTEELEDSAKLVKRTNHTYVWITVEYFPGFKESEKHDIRKYYINRGILTNWEACQTDDMEEWKVVCLDGCDNRESDVPVKPNNQQLRDVYYDKLCVDFDQ